MAIYQSVVLKSHSVAEHTTEIMVQRPERFLFSAGQYVQIGVPHLRYPDEKGTSRVLSIASSPNESRHIAVAFRDTGSGFKRTLSEMKEGDSVFIEGPYGSYILSEETNTPLVLVAGGIGITPHVSMIRYASEQKINIPITLVYANRNYKSAAYVEELKALERNNEQFTLQLHMGSVDEHCIAKAVQNISKNREAAWLLSGPPAMVDRVRGILSLLGIDGRNIFFEPFVGY